MPEDVWRAAERLAREARLFLSLGSSLVVQPAASLPEMALEHGARLVIINHDPTPLDDSADCVIRNGIGETMQAIMVQLNQPV
jgi:NAD-dependent deacetylase